MHAFVAESYHPSQNCAEYPNNLAEIATLRNFAASNRKNELI